MPRRLQFALPMLQSGTVLMSENIPYVQLQMVLPRARFATLPAPHLPPGYTLRTFQPGDESEFLRVLNLQDWGAWTPERLQPWLQRIVPASWYMCIHQADGRLAATAMGLDDSSDLHPSGGELGWVAADPAHRGKGLGTAVCAAATARLLQAGYRQVHLFTEHWRLPAIHIYFKLGYVPLLHLPEMYDRWRVICDQLERPFEPDAWIAALEQDG
jgi:mycothiol synthase